MCSDFISILDISKETLWDLIDSAKKLKSERKKGIHHEPLRGKNLALIFEKPSTRTRISFEVGMNELGGDAIYLNANDMQLGRGEEIKDTAKVISRYVSGVMIRAFYHATIEEFAHHAEVPVIYGLSDREHPCQMLADIMTIDEHFGSTEGLKVAWIGDGNNVCNSLLLASSMTGMEVKVASPPNYTPPSDVIALAQKNGGLVQLSQSPMEAAKNADVILTDTWVSMGNETERLKRIEDFKDYRVTNEIMFSANPDAVFLHCLPAHRGEEVSDEVIDGPSSLVWDEAENRLHAQKALMQYLFSKNGLTLNH